MDIPAQHPKCVFKVTWWFCSVVSRTTQLKEGLLGSCSQPTTEGRAGCCHTLLLPPYPRTHHTPSVHSAYLLTLTAHCCVYTERTAFLRRLFTAVCLNFQITSSPSTIIREWKEEGGVKKYFIFVMNRYKIGLGLKTSWMDWVCLFFNSPFIIGENLVYDSDRSVYYWTFSRTTGKFFSLLHMFVWRTNLLVLNSVKIILKISFCLR